MQSRKQASTMLDAFEDLARADDARQYSRKFGQSFLSVFLTGDAFTYQWGVNMVPKAVALSVVETFGESVQR